MFSQFRFIFFIGYWVFLAFSSCTQYERQYNPSTDEWQYNPSIVDQERVQPNLRMASPAMSSSYMSKKIGFSAGGAKDINNFRENIINGFLPLPTDISYEGLFYDYYFDTGLTKSCDKLFCPSYTSAISKDPFSKKEEYFLSVGLNSGIEQKDFSRKKMNLVIVIDISGSMAEQFDSYYYDQYGKKEEDGLFEKDSEGELNKTKLESASESVVALLDHLNPEDSFGVVLFDDKAYLGKSLGKVSETNLKNIKNHILQLEPEGGTNMSSGMSMAERLLKDYAKDEKIGGEVENRIIFLTDAQPNTGVTDEEGLFGMLKANAKQKIYTSFIGIGVDFNTELIEAINKVPGANYYAVHSAVQFKKRMSDEFDFMVTPLVFDLELKLIAHGFKIKKIYGSPEARESTGEIMKVATLFPSQRTDKKTRGGIVLLHLEKMPEAVNHTIQLTVTYKDRGGQVDSDSVKFEFKKGTEFYDNTGIRKGLVLARYASLIKNWLLHERDAQDSKLEKKAEGKKRKPVTVSDYEIKGIFIPDEYYPLGNWERQSKKLSVSEEYKKLFKKFHSYFEKEMEDIEDSSMDKELKILKILTK